MGGAHRRGLGDRVPQTATLAVALEAAYQDSTSIEKEERL